MNKIMILFLIIFLIPVLFYFLWINGIMILNAKRAVVFIGSFRGKNKCEVTFSSCSGSVKKVIKLKENREYTFHLDCDVSKGNLHIIIENSKKEVLLDLTQEVKTGSLKVDDKNRYILLCSFENADGHFKLQWD